MTESPYAIPEEDLVATARVPLAAQLEEQPERRLRGGDTSAQVPWGDGMAADADGE
jgi:hypothetical protein